MTGVQRVVSSPRTCLRVVVYVYLNFPIVLQRIFRDILSEEFQCLWNIPEMKYYGQCLITCQSCAEFCNVNMCGAVCQKSHRRRFGPAKLRHSQADIG